MKLNAIFGAALLAASTLVFAQAPGGGAPTEAQKKERQERREKMKAAHQEAVKACEGKQGEERHKCMTTNMCAKAPNPKECEARAAKRHEKMKERHAKGCADAKDPAKCEAERKARREKVREACKGKEGEALKTCIREQRGKK
jgi:hypothetical protein